MAELGTISEHESGETEDDKHLDAQYMPDEKDRKAL
jgi:hypothetical protein